MSRKEWAKVKIMQVMLILAILSSIIYYLFSESYRWVSFLMPEIIGITVLGVTVSFAIKKNTKLKTFLILFGSICLSSILGFWYGYTNDIVILKDILPEFFGGTFLGIVLSLIFKKKVM